MNERFLSKVNHVLDVEGGFVNDPVDRGGATKFGITLSTYKTLVDPNATVETIKKLTREDAIDFYYRYFWNPHEAAVRGYNYSQLPQGVGEIAFDFAINMGHRRSHILLQKALRFLGHKITLDGILGQETVDAASRAPQNELIKRVGAEAVVFYTRIIINDSSQQKFARGWAYRATSSVFEASKQT